MLWCGICLATLKYLAYNHGLAHNSHSFSLATASVCVCLVPAAVERSMPELVAAYEEEVRERAVSASSAFGKVTATIYWDTSLCLGNWRLCDL